MARDLSRSYLKPEKTDKYVDLHLNPYPEIMDILRRADKRNYSIWIYKNELYNYMEEILNSGTDESNFAEEDLKQANNEWIKNVRPCFLYHEQGIYEDELTEILHIEGEGNKRNAIERKVYRFSLGQDKIDLFSSTIKKFPAKLSELLISHNIGKLTVSQIDNDIYVYYEYYGGQYNEDVGSLLNDDFIIKLKTEFCMSEAGYTEFRQIFFSL